MIESKNIFLENLITWVIIIGTLFSLVMVFFTELRDTKLEDASDKFLNWFNSSFLVWWNKHKELEDE